MATKSFTQTQTSITDAVDAMDGDSAAIRDAILAIANTLEILIPAIHQEFADLRAQIDAISNPPA